MVSALEALGNAARSAYCAISGPAATGLSILGNIYRGLGAPENGDDLIASADLFRAGSELACNRPPTGAGDVPVVPFEGGQCDDIRYQLEFTVSISSAVSRVTGFGPIRQLGVNPINDMSKALQYAFEGGDTNFPPDLPGGVFNAATVPNDFPDPTFTSFNVTTVSGQPDVCGNPPPILPPYDVNDWTTTQPVTFDDDAGNPVTFDVDLVFGPSTQGPGGAISIPINFTFEDGSSLFGDFNLTTGDISIGNNNSGGDGADNSPEELDPDEDPEDNDRVVVGVRVVTTVIGESDATREIFQSGGNPNIYGPSLGHVNFKYRLSTGEEGWGPDIRVKNTEFIAWAGKPAIAVRGTPNLGTEFSVRALVTTVAPNTIELPTGARG